MLVIRRRIGESLYIGDEVEVQVLDVCGTQVKIGIQAPRDIVILRTEMRLAAESNRLAARYSNPGVLQNLAKNFRSRLTKAR